MKTTIANEAERGKLLRHINDLQINPARPWRVEIKKLSKPRSVGQIRLYYAWCEIAADHFGYWKDDMDEILREHCKAPVHTYVNLEGVEVERYSLSDADSAEMAGFMERVQLFLTAEHGLMLPSGQDEARYW